MERFRDNIDFDYDTYEMDFHEEKFGSIEYYNNYGNEKNNIEEIENDFKFTMPIQSNNGGREFQSMLKSEKALTEHKKGTTTLGFVYKNGVIIAVDSRASMGNFMGSKTVRKVIEINDFLLGTMAGGAADCQFWLRRLNMWCKIFELRYGERVSISSAANYLTNMISGYKGQGLSMGTMVAGWDKHGPQLYYVDDDGKCLGGKIFSAGSGSTFAFGVVDSRYKWDMTTEEAVKLGYEAICHATYRDCGSGGYVRVYSVKENSWDKVFDGDDVNEFHWKFARQQGLIGDGDETKKEFLKN